MRRPPTDRLAVALSCAAALLAACDAGAGQPAADAAPPDAFIGPAQALFEVPRGAPPPSGFYALPYPNDLRVGEDGRVDLSDYVRPNAIIDLYIEAVAERVEGFGLSSAIFFRFDAPIDVSSLPSSPQASRLDDASVYLVDIDPGSPRRGQRWPARFRFERFAGETIGEHWLSVLPYPGFPLAEETTYAVVVTRRLRASDGSPVAVAPDLAAIAAADQPADPYLARAQAIYQPLWDWLDEAGGDERADVVSAAVFTTQRASDLMGAIREVIWEEVPPPRPRDITWVREGADHIWYNGVYDGPNFQTGEVPYQRPEDGGEIVLDPETGRPVLQRMEKLRFSFTIPKGEMPEGGWPVVLYAHGTGGSYHSFRNDGTGQRLAERGLAVIGVDQVLHGPRNPDRSPEVSFFNFQNPLAARDNTLQGALDNFQLVRLVLDFDHTERHPGGRTIRFDPDRIYFFGHSQGGLTGPPFLAHEPLIKGVVLSGAGGILYLSLLLKTEPVDISSIIAAFIRDWPLDEFNPVLAMLQQYMERADPVTYAPLLARRPLEGVGAKHVFLSEGLVDTYTPVPSIEALATAIGGHLVAPELQPVEGLALRGLPVLEPPVTGNLDVDGEDVTAVLLQYEERPGSDGHFVIFHIEAARVQSAEFLGTLAATGAATLVAPP